MTGLDHDEKVIEEAKNNFSNYPSVEFAKGDATNMPFHDEEFDFVMCMGSFANFADQKIQILKEMKRVLKETGRIIISVFSEDAFEERMKVYKFLNVKIKDVRGTTVIFDDSVGDNISEQFTKGQLEELFGKAGLIAEDIIKSQIAYLCKLRK